MPTLAKRVVFAVVCAAAGAGGALALSHRADERPSAKEKDKDEAWFPKAFERSEDGKSRPTLPPTAFPDLNVPEAQRLDEKSLAERIEAIEKRRPRLNGKAPLKIEPADDTLRKLLKARLHQAVLEYRENQKIHEIGGPDPSRLALEVLWLNDLTTTVSELHSGQPRELVAWLEEILLVAKEKELYADLRVAAGAIRLIDLYSVSRARLKIEAELLKAKNAK